MFMIHRYRQLSTVVLLAVCMFAVAACGSSSKTSSTPSGGAGARSAGFKITTSERSCLKKHGVTLPTGGFAGHGGHFAKGGKPPAGAKFPGRGKGAKGSFAHGGSAQNSARSKALKACGVSFGGGPRGGPGGAGTTAAG
jgi:hypothetical protein